MGFGRYRFRRSFGQVKSQFRGARPKFYPLFTGLLDTYAGAAAAYSLRRLSKIASSVVRVRRASDNAEKDFTADNITDGAMVNWVNGQIVPPLDIRELDANGERTGALVEAAAAYSLRNLSDSYAGDVVEVRRNTDGSTQDFNAAEVSDNTLTDWVNTSFADDLPLDTSSGAAAAYSLRNLSSSYTGSVVEVRRSSDGEEDSFTASDVADGTLTDWVVEDVADLIDDAKYFNGTSGYVDCGANLITGYPFEITATIITTQGSGVLSAANTGSSTSGSKYGVEVVNGFPILRCQSSSTGGQQVVGSTAVDDGLPHILRAVFTSSSSRELFVDGVSVGTDNANILFNGGDRVNIGRQYDSTPSNYFEGAVFDVNINNVSAYTGLGNDPWDDTIGSNDGTPSNLVTFTGQGYDGFVAKWYDQSGNANHATQGTDASQPKIVDAGSLVSGGMDFDGSDDGLFTSSNLTDTLQSATIFALTQDDTTSGIASMVRLRPNGALGSLDGLVWEKTSGVTYGANTLFEGSNGAVTAAVAGQGTRTTSKNLNTLIYQQSQILAYENGGLDETLNNVAAGSVPVGDVTLVDQLWLGQNFDDNARPFNGTMQEVIIYFTDQTDKRRAIEENIGDHYGITLASFSNDGFVKTWYDQSGNTNHATQAVDASQPQIVDGGSLVSGGLDFDGVDDSFQLSSDIVVENLPLGVFAIQDTQTNNNVTLGTTTNRVLSFDDTKIIYYLTPTQRNIDFSSTISGEKLFSVIHDGTTDTDNLKGYVNGEEFISNSDTGTQNATSGIRFIGTRKDVDLYLSGTIQEIIIYNTDQTDNRTAIEANIGETYSIDLPSGVDTGYDQVDGFVETWYDQSGNGNDAVQQVSGSQPKIVDAGSLVTGGLDFDGVNDFFETSLVPPNVATLIGVANWDVIDITGIIIGARDSITQRSYISNSGSISKTLLGVSDDILRGSTPVAGDDYLLFGTYSGSARLLSTNGSVVSDSNGSSPNNTIQGYSIGALNSAGANGSFMTGTIGEVIVYPSDQSANRVAIETDINDHYDIYA